MSEKKHTSGPGMFGLDVLIPARIGRLGTEHFVIKVGGICAGAGAELVATALTVPKAVGTIIQRAGYST